VLTWDYAAVAVIFFDKCS